VIEEGLREYLIGHVELASVVAGRVYPLVIPLSVSQDCIVYRKRSGGRVQLIDQAAGDARPTFTISACSQEYQRAVDLGQRIFRALEMFDGTWGTHEINCVRSIDSRDDFYEPDDGSGVFWYLRHEEFEIQFSEEIPA